MARRLGQREIVLQRARREIPHCQRTDDPRRERPCHGELCRRLHGDFFAASGVRERHELWRIVAHDSFAEPEPPAAEDAGVAGVSVDDGQTPHAAHALVGELRERRALRGLKQKRLDGGAVAPRHADDGRGAARRRQSHEQLAGRGMLDGERQLELACRAVAFDGELAQQGRVHERRESDGRGAGCRTFRRGTERRPHGSLLRIDRNDVARRERHVPIRGRARKTQRALEPRVIVADELGEIDSRPPGPRPAAPLPSARAGSRRRAAPRGHARAPRATRTR